MALYYPGDEPIKDYVLVRHLGSGSFGDVWKALGPGDVSCALKIIPDLRERGGNKEFRALSLLRDLRHVHLVPIQGFWVKDRAGVGGRVIADLSKSPSAELDKPRQTEVVLSATQRIGSPEAGRRAEELIIAMGLCDTSLETVLQKEHPEGIPIADLIRYMTGAAQAIDYVNAHEIQHCDIKPGNILVLGDHAQVCDFGLAQEIGDNLDSTSVACSPVYADPVVLEGDEPVETTDLYCLAMTYAELRTGHLPFKREANFTRRSQVLKAKKTADFDLSDLSEAERKIILTALAPNPADRLYCGARKAQDFVDALFHVTMAPPQPIPSSPPRQISRSMWAVATVAILAVVMVMYWLLPTGDRLAVRDSRKLMANARYRDAAKVANDKVKNSTKRQELLNQVSDAWYENALRANQNSSSKLQLFHEILASTPLHAASRESRATILRGAINADLPEIAQILTVADGIPNDDSRDLLDELWLVWATRKAQTSSDEELASKFDLRIKNQGAPITSVQKLTTLFYWSQQAQRGDAPEPLTDRLLHRNAEVTLDDLAKMNDTRAAMPTRTTVALDRVIAQALDEYAKQPIKYKEVRALVMRLAGPDTGLLRDAEMRALVNEGNLEAARVKVGEFPAAAQDGLRAMIQVCDPQTEAEPLRAAVALMAENRTELFRRFIGPESPVYGYAATIAKSAETTHATSGLGDEAAAVIRASGQVLSARQKARLARILVEVAEQSRVSSSLDVDDIRMPVETAKASVRFLELASPAIMEAELKLRLWRELSVATYFANASAPQPDSVEKVIAYTNDFLADPARAVPLDVDFVRCQSLLQVTPSSDAQFADLASSGGRLVRNWMLAVEAEKAAPRQRLEGRRHLYETLVQPVLKRAGELGSIPNNSVRSTLHRDLALLQNFQAITLLRDYSLRKKIGLQAAAELAHSSTLQATGLAPTNPEYLITWAQILDTWGAELGVVDLPMELRNIGDKAKTLCQGAEFDSYLPDALGIIAYASLIDVRSVASISDRRGKLTKVAQMFTAIANITLEKGYPPNPVVNLNHSTCLVELAFSDPVNRVRMLHRAEKIATDVLAKLSLDPRYDAAEAFMTRGNAREDLAYYLCQTEKYDEAAGDFRAAFDDATMHNLNDQAADRARVALARCLYRWADDEQEISQQLKRLREAADLLTVGKHTSGIALQQTREQMWRGKALFRIANLRRVSPAAAMNELLVAARDAWNTEPDDALAYQVAYLTGFYELARAGDPEYTPGDLAELAQRLISDQRLAKFAGQTAFIGQLFEVYTNAKFDWAKQQNDKKKAFEKVATEFGDLLPRAEGLCLEAVLELLLGQLECGHQIYTPEAMSDLWRRYKATAAKLGEPQRSYRGYFSISRFYFDKGDLSKASEHFAAALPLLVQHGCRDEKERRQYQAEAAVRLGTIQLRPGKHQDAKVIATTVNLLEDPTLRGELLQLIDNEEQLDNLVKLLKVIGKL